MHEWKYCPICGGALTAQRSGPQVCYTCGGCHQIHYRNPAPGVGCIVEAEGRVLLARRKQAPYAGHWNLPSGFLEYEEAVEDTAIREVTEETGLLVQLIGLFGVYSFFDDPRKNGLLVLYRAKVIGGRLAAGDDTSEVGFFGRDGLPQPVGFAAHRKALEEWQSLRA